MVAGLLERGGRPGFCSGLTPVSLKFNTVNERDAAGVFYRRTEDMSSSILEMLMENLSGEPTRQISQKVGGDEQSVSTALSGALPVLLGALNRNAGDSGGAGSLLNALNKHDGSVLDDIGGFLGQGGDMADGAGILRHTLGQKQGNVEAGISKMSGLDSGSVSQILAMVAPLVMGALGKQQRQQGLDVSGLAGMLGQENQAVGQRAPDAMGLVGSLLDSDGDGQVADDVMEIGGKLLGGLFGNKK